MLRNCTHLLCGLGSVIWMIFLYPKNVHLCDLNLIADECITYVSVHVCVHVLRGQSVVGSNRSQKIKIASLLWFDLGQLDAWLQISRRGKCTDHWHAPWKSGADMINVCKKVYVLVMLHQSRNTISVILSVSEDRTRTDLKSIILILQGWIY